jgi:fatty-acyl-CoA synthase
MSGYYNDPAATAETIKNGWLHTGDMGFVIDGQLFVCGRIKDLIIAAGRNYYPADIEWIASEVPGLRPGRVVAFSLNLSTRNESERVILCAESKTRRADRSALAEKIRVHVLEHLGLRVDEVVLLERGSLPRTSSGKLQRIKTREMYLERTLESAGRNEGKIALLGHLISSRWGFLRSRTINLVSKRRPEHNSQSTKSPSESAYS